MVAITIGWVISDKTPVRATNRNMLSTQTWFKNHQYALNWLIQYQHQDWKYGENRHINFRKNLKTNTLQTEQDQLPALPERLFFLKKQLH